MLDTQMSMTCASIVILRDLCAVRKDFFEMGHNIIEDFAGERPEILEYWDSEKYTFKEARDDSKESKPSKSPEEVLDHVEKMRSLVEQKPQFVDERAELLRKRESAARRKRGCHGN